ncbi:hypothetical protein AAGS61_08835 [Lysinibacillus sp. KU-BSD001]|uniref:hypothetical protein n=1 Tax=Lysinibacillus sp. KU-BSD001 TaxID=3141328 RepID=UPI0036E27985
MGKGKMVLVSGIITVCLSTIAIVALLLMSEDSPLKKLKEAPLENATAATVVPVEEEVHIEDSNVGIKTMTDKLGTHDILFESGAVAHTATSGPVQLTVTEVRLEQLIAANDQIKKAVEGHDRATLAVLEVTVENNGGQPVLFNLDDAKVIADSNETTVLNPKFSHKFGAHFEPNEKKQGTVMIDFASKPRDIASIQLKIAPVYDQNYDELGEPIVLKVPMY